MREKNDINEFNVDQRNTISNLISDFRKKIYNCIELYHKDIRSYGTWPVKSFYTKCMQNEIKELSDVFLWNNLWWIVNIEKLYKIDNNIDEFVMQCAWITATGKVRSTIQEPQQLANELLENINTILDAEEKTLEFFDKDKLNELLTTYNTDMRENEQCRVFDLGHGIVMLGNNNYSIRLDDYNIDTIKETIKRFIKLQKDFYWDKEKQKLERKEKNMTNRIEDFLWRWRDAHILASQNGILAETYASFWEEIEELWIKETYNFKEFEYIIDNCLYDWRKVYGLIRKAPEKVNKTDMELFNKLKEDPIYHKLIGSTWADLDDINHIFDDKKLAKILYQLSQK